MAVHARPDGLPIAGVVLHPDIGGLRPLFEDMARRIPDISLINRVTGWRPSRSLDDILSDVIAHERGTLAAEGAGGQS